MNHHKAGSEPAHILYRIAAVLSVSVLSLSFMLAVFDYEETLAAPSTDSAVHASNATGAITLTTNAVGDLVPRIDCGGAYTATIYAQGLSAPDGLAFGPDDLLYVAEEGGGRVSRIAANGTATPVITGLDKPEGIAFDNAGNLYTVEDVTGGRVVKRATNGLTSTVVSGLEAPEGITWVADGSPDGILYVTESNLEQALSISSINPSDYRTRVSAVSPSGIMTPILTTTGIITPSGGLPPTLVEGLFWSYTGEAVLGPDGLLYVSNELSGQTISETITSPFPIEFRAESTDSIFTIDPAILPTAPISFSTGLTAPEGLQFSLDGNFPLYVAEEGMPGEADGRVTLVDQNGNPTTLCTGFEDIEDITLDDKGRLYVSEDPSGLIILLTPGMSLVFLPIILRP